MAASGRRLPGSDRQVWLVVSAVIIVACVVAVAVPSARDGTACAVAGLIGIGSEITGRRRRRRERQALAARRAAVSRDGIPGDVIALVAGGKKIRAIRWYRELTRVGLKEAKGVIDSL